MWELLLVSALAHTLAMAAMPGLAATLAWVSKPLYTSSHDGIQALQGLTAGTGLSGPPAF